ncbi:uncharacterized protein [Henckelia pumila]|uniref:uncharacterized protein isoform X2 n=1 Tax=Henckelia pumila TaxID=405737 RepID=UPI003C6E8370
MELQLVFVLPEILRHSLPPKMFQSWLKNSSFSFSPQPRNGSYNRTRKAEGFQLCPLTLLTLSELSLSHVTFAPKSEGAQPEEEYGGWSLNNEERSFFHWDKMLPARDIVI